MGEQMAYTIQKCRKCGKLVKIDFLWRLLNLDKPIFCKECRKLRTEGQENAGNTSSFYRY